MPEYLAPGVYVEETSFRAKSIEGVSTSTAAFVGPTRKGPTEGPPVLVTSFGDFERVFGGFGNLVLGEHETVNDIAHAVRAYFDNGGARLFLARVYNGSGGTAATAWLGGDSDNVNNLRFVARTPGRLGNGSVTVTLRESAASEQSLARAPRGSLVRQGTALYLRGETGFVATSDGGSALSADGSEVFVIAQVLWRDADGNEEFYENLGLGAGHPRFIADVLRQDPDRLVDRLELPLALELGAAIDLRTGAGVARLHAILADEDVNGRPLDLSGGSDGAQPGSGDYTGPLAELARIDDIAIVAAPGHGRFSERQAIQGALVAHAEARKAYRFAVLETSPGLLPAEALAEKSMVDSSHAALYYPWVVVANPQANPNNASIPRELTLPPSGFVCGIFARNDIERSVSKSPGNEIVRGAIRFERPIGMAEQELLNPRGVNCLRFFPGRGYRLWGARTASSDPEWKYIGPRRYFLFLEHSIDRSTQWAVFENNGPRLWANVSEAVSDFLYNEWRSGNLLGDTPEQAFFVRCDRSTMTQNDLDNGRLICLIGVAVLKPAEFVVFRIGQKTADAGD